MHPALLHPLPASRGSVSRVPSFAFSLVELSIVLVILGLLTGGILAGQSLIRAAELRAVIGEIQRYQAAVHTFRDKYMALPGDMRNAVRFWGAQAGGTADGADATCAALTVAATGTATCNGNGDGAVTIGYEIFRAWQHLADAGLVEGSFTGIANAAGTNLAIPGDNVPQSRIAQVGHTLFTYSSATDSGSWFKSPSAALLLSTGKAYTNNETRIAFLLPEEAWNIDTKMDDGKPTQGFILSTRDAACTTTLDSATADYLLTGTAQGCILRTFFR